MIEYLKSVFTPLFLACLVACIIAGVSAGWVAVFWYIASAVLFIADIIDCTRGE